MSAIEEKKNRPPDKSYDFFKCVKIPLKHVLKNPDINLPKITNAVIKCNKIVINTLMFMKLYLLDYFEKNKEIDNIYKLIGYKSSQDRIKYYDTRLYIPTIFFRAYYSKPKDYQIDWNKYSMKEKKLFEKDKNMKKYIIMNEAEHFIWKNQEFSDIIIETIKQILQ